MKPIIALMKNSTDYFKDNSVIMQFIPIFLILYYSTYRYSFSKLSHSVLGKLFAIIMILYYTRMDFIYGTICCVLVILYYQMTEIEGFESKAEDEEEKKRKEEPAEDGTNLPPTSEDTETASGQTENFETFKKEPSIINIEHFNAARDEFIKEKCKNGVLMYKDFPVKSEMADHVYSEIKFNTKTKCNPCDRTCSYNIIEAKLKTEDSLIPKSSNEMFDSIKSIFYPKDSK